MKRLTLILFGTFILTACGNKGEVKPDEVAPPPAEAVLVAPAQNEVCTQGTVISATQSTVQLKWNAAKATDSYEITIKNLEKGTTVTQTTTTTQFDVTMDRNTPYSWFVTSKSAATTATAKSAVWKFYNSGPGIVNYAPFPAEPVNPAAGQNVAAVDGKVNLTWTGADADNDISGYDIYLGTSVTSIPLVKSNITDMFLNGNAVISGATYYWRVVTRDSKGNTSDSGVLSFKVN
jgi:predicted small lipoprotein YifL